MGEPQRGKCRSCNADILWVKTELGKLMPLDAEPSEKGNIVLTAEGACRVLGGGLFDDSRPGTPKYQSHFVSCPNAGTHRKKKGKS